MPKEVPKDLNENQIDFLRRAVEDQIEHLEGEIQFYSIYPNQSRIKEDHIDEINEMKDLYSKLPK